MNPVFWLLILLVVFVVWVISRPLWKPLGEWLCTRSEKIHDTLNETDKKEEKGE